VIVDDGLVRRVLVIELLCGGGFQQKMIVHERFCHDALLEKGKFWSSGLTDAPF